MNSPGCRCIHEMRLVTAAIDVWVADISSLISVASGWHPRISRETYAYMGRTYC